MNPPITDTSSFLPRRHTSRAITVLLPVGGLLLLALCGLAVFGLVTVEVGAVAVLVGVVAAVVPVAVVIPAFLWVDRWEPEPARLLLLTFAWGACVATLTALLINDTAQAVGDLLLGTGGGDQVSALVSAPLVEEAAKIVPVVAVLLSRSREFDGVVDGIVYAGFSAAGFAFTENIFYFGRAFAEYGFGDATTAGVFASFLIRGVLSPFAHPLFTVLAGIGLGLIVDVHRRWVRLAVPLGAYLAAVCLHGLWNAAATLGGAQTFLDVYFLIMVPMFGAVVLLVLWQRRREQRIIAAALPDMVAEGWIARSEVPLLASLAGRRRWRRQVRQRSGRTAARAVANYQAGVTELAFSRRWAAGSDESRRRHDELVQVVRATRAEAVRLAQGEVMR